MEKDRKRTGSPVDLANSSSHIYEEKVEDEKYYYALVALSRISAAISGLYDLDAILKIGLDSVLKIMGGAVGGIMLLDESSRTLYYQAYHGLSTKYAEVTRLGLGEGIAGKVAQSGRSMLIEDISSDPSLGGTELTGLEDLRAFASVPLRAKESTLGVMNVGSHTPHHFTKSDVFLLHSIGDLLGIAIEQAKLYEQLRKGRERYRQLARQLLKAQEEERRRIARELHDETSQTLSGLALNLQALIDMAEIANIKDTEFKARLKKTHSLAVQVSTEVSSLIAGLRPTLLDTLGLIPAIRQYAHDNLTHMGITVSLDLEGVGVSLPPEVETELFRIVQGSIGNIIRHSQARNATISLKREGDKLVLCISDDGKGFDVSKITGIEESGRGAGLFGMRERVRSLGGDGVVESQPGQGTTVTAWTPITWEQS